MGKDNNSNSRKQILKLTENFGLLKGKVDQMEKNQTDNGKNLGSRMVDMHNSVKKVIENHDSRINTLEDESAKMKGKAVGIALTVSIIISLIGVLIALARAAFF